jgi:hypothetical protein
LSPCNLLPKIFNLLHGTFSTLSYLVTSKLVINAIFICTSPLKGRTLMLYLAGTFIRSIFTISIKIAQKYLEKVKLYRGENPILFDCICILALFMHSPLLHWNLFIEQNFGLMVKVVILVTFNLFGFRFILFMALTLKQFDSSSPVHAGVRVVVVGGEFVVELITETPQFSSSSPNLQSLLIKEFIRTFSFL